MVFVIVIKAKTSNFLTLLQTLLIDKDCIYNEKDVSTGTYLYKFK